MENIEEIYNKISVIIPAYNASQFIEATLDSVIGQTHPIDEVLIIDDCSTDNTVEIVNKYRGRYKNIQLIQQPMNQGGSAARNLGLKIARNEWILFMDADDVAHPTLLEKEVNLLSEINENQADIILVHPAYIQIDENGAEIPGSEMRGKQLEAHEIFGTLLFRNHIITPSGLLLKREKALEVGGFQKFQIVEDYDFVLRMSRQGYFAYVDEPLIYLRRHGANLTKDISKARDAEKAIVEQYGIDTIKKAIFARNLPYAQNLIDFVNMLFRYEQWEEGFNQLKASEVVDVEKENIQISVTFLYGIYYLHKQSYTEALNFFHDIIEKKPSHGAALNNISVLYILEKKNIEKSMQLLKKAIEIYPGYMDAMHNLQLIEENRVNYDENHPTQNDFRFTWRELRPQLLRYS
ncbi:hypothetical protein BHU72_00275 [Desulfuribacillus stibiiarsenatis]|uniref:Glycosyltransferase 2-like domain-containing protein n=1 Tax=Desulfuribacillus stibiiarsenatis TaxID=1390249 RepID=A0A1E5L9A9_9FIRM|nr:glycosyltransferase family 2 protein [Desulfuribacillus stibiiarsenatis]OEH86747.1 hypothetical protein BHU72_00275 [Desulfuribacillus stibiiarsenatis]